jgi:aquaporin Z
MKIPLTEGIGTFFLVLVVVLVSASGTPLGGVAVGLTLTALVYMGGHVSGAHYNPAVTVAVLMRGGVTPAAAMTYWLSQLAGAVLAAVVGAFLVGRTVAVAPGMGVGVGQALVVEVLFTFLLALVVLNVAVTKATSGNQYYGLAIGITVLGGAIAAGGISGGAFNPAVGLGPMAVDAVMGTGGFGNAWLYLVGPVTGGALAAGVHRVQTA